MLRRIRRSSITLSVLCGIFLLATPSQAYPPNTLAEAISRSSKRERGRIPLLTLNTEQASISWADGSQEKLHELYREEDAKPPLSQVLPLFKRQIIPCSSVQVIAPLKRVMLNPYPGPPEAWARIGRERAARLLFTSLSPAQWVTASSTNGIGLTDLRKEEQKVWLLSLLPEPFVLTEATAGENGSITFSSTGANGGLKTATISPEQVRLRVIRSMSWSYRQGPQGGYASYGDSDHDNRQPGQRFWMQMSQKENKPPAESYRDRLKDAVRIEKPNRLQKGDLSFNSPPLFGKTISFAGAKTLGDLVQRVAEATGVELYADRRLTGLSVTVVGDENATADAADVMKALCLATTGTIRKVTDPTKGESVYLLAGDHDAMMPSRLRLAEWASDVNALLNAEQTTFQKNAMESGVVRGVGFAEDARGRISDGIMLAAEERITDPNRYRNNSYNGFVPIPVNALPSEGQAKVRRDLERRREYSSGNGEPWDEKNVYAQFSVKTQLIVPGYCTVEGPRLASLDELLKRKPAPISTPRPSPQAGVIRLPPVLQKFAALKVALKDEDESEAASKWAAGRGFAALFVRVSLWDDTDQKRLSRIVATAEKHGVKIYPVVSLLRVPPAEAAKSGVPPHNLARARNIFGETLREYAYRRKDAIALAANKYEADQIAPYRDSDWLDASDEAVRKAVAMRVTALAQMPGIAGVVWEDVAAPGTAPGQYSWTNGTVAGRFAGFTDSLRVAFIRQENADPIDVPPYGTLEPNIYWDSGERTPFIANEWELRERFRQHPAYRKDAMGAWKAEKETKSNEYDFASTAWNNLVREANRAWVGNIRREANLPATLSLYLEAPAESSGYNLTPWTAPWAASEPLMPNEMGKQPLLPLTIRSESTRDSVRTGLTTQLKQRLGKGKTPAYSGLIIDLTSRPLNEGLSLLSPLATVAK